MCHPPPSHLLKALWINQARLMAVILQMKITSIPIQDKEAIMQCYMHEWMVEDKLIAAKCHRHQ